MNITHSKRLIKFLTVFFFNYTSGRRVARFAIRSRARAPPIRMTVRDSVNVPRASISESESKFTGMSRSVSDTIQFFTQMTISCRASPVGACRIRHLSSQLLSCLLSYATVVYLRWIDSVSTYRSPI